MTPEYRIEMEAKITEYVSNIGAGIVVNMQVESTFKDLGFEANVWNVKTDGEAQWIVEGPSLPMNIYTQKEFYFSADEAYSFHVGISERLNARYRNDFKHVIDELPLDIDSIKSISRKLNSAASSVEAIKAPEDVQKIALLCRESLIDLAGNLKAANTELTLLEEFKRADFKNISREVIGHYARGASNSNLRKHCRKITESAWDYASELVHSSSKNMPDAKLCLLFTCSAVSVIQNLYLKYLGFDTEPKCLECNSMNCDIDVDEDNRTLVVVCLDCGSVQEHQIELEIAQEE